MELFGSNLLVGPKRLHTLKLVGGRLVIMDSWLNFNWRATARRIKEAIYSGRG